MKNYLFLFLTVLLLAVEACSQKDNILNFKLDVPFSLNQGDTAAWEDNNAIQLKFDKVVSDSRCPIDVVCVWAGRAEVEITFSQPGSVLSGTLIAGDTSGSGYTDRADFGDFSVRLIKLNPAPLANQPIPQSAYVAELEVKKNR